MDRDFHTASANLQFVPPMLLRRVPQLPEGPEWQYEVKWDGYRMQAMKSGRSVRLISRNGADFTRRFPEVAEAVAPGCLPRMDPHEFMRQAEFSIDRFRT